MPSHHRLYHLLSPPSIVARLQLPARRLAHGIPPSPESQEQAQHGRLGPVATLGSEARIHLGGHAPGDDHVGLARNPRPLSRGQTAQTQTHNQVRRGLLGARVPADAQEHELLQHVEANQGARDLVREDQASVARGSYRISWI